MKKIIVGVVFTAPIKRMKKDCPNSVLVDWASVFLRACKSKGWFGSPDENRICFAELPIPIIQDYPNAAFPFALEHHLATIRIDLPRHSPIEPFGLVNGVNQSQFSGVNSAKWNWWRCQHQLEDGRSSFVQKFRNKWTFHLINSIGRAGWTNPLRRVSTVIQCVH